MSLTVPATTVVVPGGYYKVYVTLLIVVTKYPSRSKLREEGFSGLMFEDIVHHDGEGVEAGMAERP